MSYVVNSVEFEDRWTTMLFTVSLNSTELLLYAFFVISFLFSVHSLRQRMRGGRMLITAAWVMFALATCSTSITSVATGISMRMVYLQVQGLTDMPARLLHLYQALALAQDILLALNNLLTDLLFLYRCYMIWGSRRTILILPAILILATVVIGCISGLGYYGIAKMSVVIDPRVPFSMGGLTNILLVCLTAGRIFYIRRELQTFTGHSFRKQYDTAVAIILESGLLYSLCVIIYVTSISIKSTSASATIFNGVAWGLVQLGVNIVPTLILVRVGMGRSTENTPSMTLTMDTCDQMEPSPIFAVKDDGRPVEKPPGW
ncbi:hypothetical protein MVEN_00482200 [Mycena venus]|uniref:Uncharacterized protein n=1 Tax=Mycena venus TaxID=2733690 RepID=A0A8H6YRV6_9AGAR|nr:hypothetical protein MVEN_00482200 [Mycena venus]